MEMKIPVRRYICETNLIIDQLWAIRDRNVTVLFPEVEMAKGLNLFAGKISEVQFQTWQIEKVYRT